jgi:hypothetical protein
VFGARTSGHLRRGMRRCAEIDAEEYRSVAALPGRAGRGATPSDDSVSSETVSTSSKVPTVRISTKGSNEQSSQ